MFDPALIAAGPAYVIDGDSLRIGQERIRLFGVDAPEMGQRCGPAACGVQARAWLVAYIDGRPVRCVGMERDRYRRLIARCSVAGADLGRQLVTAGQAVAYRQYSRDYVGAEAAARRARRGIWALGFRMPQEWRRSP